MLENLGIEYKEALAFINNIDRTKWNIKGQVFALTSDEAKDYKDKHGGETMYRIN